MGRETVAVVHWRGEAAETRVLLETDALILRGGTKGRIARSAIADVGRTDRGVALTADGAPLVIEMEAAEAARWVKALTTAPPGLAAKLGVGPEKRALVLGHVDDEVLAAALAGAMTDTLAEAAVIVVMVGGQADLEAALEVARGVPLWCVYEKGQKAGFGDAAVRGFLRARGYIDSKSTAVSARLTATRYGVRRGA